MKLKDLEKKIEAEGLTKKLLIEFLVELYDTQGLHPDEVLKDFAFYPCPKCSNILIIKKEKQRNERRT